MALLQLPLRRTVLFQLRRMTLRLETTMVSAMLLTLQDSKLQLKGMAQFHLKQKALLQLPLRRTALSQMRQLALSQSMSMALNQLPLKRIVLESTTRTLDQMLE